MPHVPTRLPAGLLSLLLCAAPQACALEYEFGANGAGSESGQEGGDPNVLELPGGTIEFTRFELVVLQTTHIGTGPSGGVDLTRDGPWMLDVLAQTNQPALPNWELESGDWQDLKLGASLVADPQGSFMIATFEDDDGGSRNVLIEFDTDLELLLDRDGLTRLDDPLSISLNDRLRPIRWFPTVNLTNLAVEGDGSILLNSATNEVVHAQVVEALVRSARDWLEDS